MDYLNESQKLSPQKINIDKIKPLEKSQKLNHRKKKLKYA